VGTRDWAVALAHLGKPDAAITELTEGFRVPGAVIEYAARLLPRSRPASVHPGRYVTAAATSTSGWWPIR